MTYKRIFYSLAAALMTVAAVPCGARSTDILLEAESFQHLGGWSVDKEAFTLIQSATLMAHGCGRVVEDASTTLEIAKEGVYDVWVSTSNWTAPWYDGKGPGAFDLMVNGQMVASDLGTEGGLWHWQYAGKVTLGKSNSIVLKDRSGFDGRVDAIYFSSGGKAPSYTSLKRGAGLRHVGGYDLVVCGGGVAGCSTALTAARLGLKVALINNMPLLGGNAVFGVRCGGLFCDNLYPGIGPVTCEMIGAEPDTRMDRGNYTLMPMNKGFLNTGAPLPSWSEVKDKVEHSTFIRVFDALSKEERAAACKMERDRIIKERKELALAYKRQQLLSEAGVDIYANMYIYKVETKGGRHIKSVTARSMRGGEDLCISGRLFSDCTGDGDIAYLAGAGYMSGRESRSFAGETHAPEQADNQCMGMTLNWFACPRIDSGTFPDVTMLPWAMQCDSTYFIDTERYSWRWETGMTRDNALESELCRDNYLRAVYGNWAYLKNHVEKYRNYRLDYFNYPSAKRESRRVIGGYVLTENDITDKTVFPDATFTTTWPMDLHYATKDNAEKFPLWEWQTWCTNKDESFYTGAVHVPYRCLYCKDVDNLLLGGRAVSVTHLALGTVRLQSTLGMAGEVAGMAASVCIKHSILPSRLYPEHFDELKALMLDGIR